MNTFNQYLQGASLLICGALLLIIGLSITLSPTQFYGSSGIELPNDISLISELRAPAGMLISAGYLILISILAKSLRPQAWLISSLVYLSYGIGRVIGIGTDGVPNESILFATAIELILGAVSLYMLIQSTAPREVNSSRTTPAFHPINK